MPTCCFRCGFYHHSVDDGYYDFEYCGANNAEFNNAYDNTKPHINPFKEKLSTCPLVPVPADTIEELSAKVNSLQLFADNISKLPNCNSCLKKNLCEFMPKYGEYCRINCPAWLGEPSREG